MSAGKRAIIIVLDSCGCGAMPDAANFGDEGSNTLKSCSASDRFNLPNLKSLGLFEIEGIKDVVSAGFADSGIKTNLGFGSKLARLKEESVGKDTTTGHWEMAGIVSETPFPTFPEGFGDDLLDRLSKLWGRGILCNKPYSGTEVIKDYGREHIATGKLIVYTSADSVLQIAAHKDVVSVPELYRYCEIARAECVGKYGVGRVIARPFEGEWPYVRTSERHDYSLVPPRNLLNEISDAGLSVVSVGKIVDIFAGSGITRFVRTSGNPEGIDKTIEEIKNDFTGLLFTNLVDTDMIYGHRRDVDGYASALSYFDEKLPEIMENMKEEDILIITADHGCDPGFKGTDHTREYVPLIITGKNLADENWGTLSGFDNIATFVKDYLDIRLLKNPFWPD
ncbi:MAG: phosphopentomutase [Lachnospiraceae bacterium]|nr:phosphopentomutase [Lachnospiraceae bacterium]